MAQKMGSEENGWYRKSNAEIVDKNLWMLGRIWNMARFKLTGQIVM